MRWRSGLVLIGLILIVLMSSVGAAAAFIPDNVTLSTDKEWLVAGSSETAIVNVKVLNLTDTSAIITGAVVTLACEDPQMCSVVTANPQTVGGPSQNVTFTIRPGTKSGDAVIRATVISPVLPIPPTNTTIQKIDHAEPKYYVQKIYQNQAVVNTSVFINISFSDIYGNSVDNRRIAEIITFKDSTSGNGGFWNETLHIRQDSLDQPVNVFGFANVTYNLSDKSGENIIQIIAPGTVVSNIQYISILGTHDDPDHFEAYISPDYDTNSTDNYHSLYANGEDAFGIYYTVFDKYDNPIPGIQIHLLRYTGDDFSILTEDKYFITNYKGFVYLEYGPTTVVQKTLLNVTAEGVPSSIKPLEDILEFTLSGPSLFVLRANPQSLASGEASKDSYTVIRAKMLDDFGRAIVNEPIQFTILPEVDHTAPLTILSSFDSNIGPTDPPIITKTVSTDKYGFADVILFPAHFPLINQSGFNDTASGVVTIRAVSQNDPDLTDTIDIVYKNYAYLHIETNAYPPIIEVNQTVNISIKLIGDGYAPTLPIDVMLCIDRGDKMFDDMYYFPDNRSEEEDKMVYAQRAAVEFVGYFKRGIDQVGLTTFGPNSTVVMRTKWSGDDGTTSDDEGYFDFNYEKGKEYYNYSSVDLPLSKVGDIDIITELENITPSDIKGGTVIVPMRYGLYKSIRELIGQGEKHSEPNSSAIKAIVLLADDAWTSWGDPIAGWDGSKVDDQHGYYPFEQDPIKVNQGGISYWTVFEDLNNTGDGNLTNGGRTNPAENMANFAKFHGIRIYTVAYFEKRNNIPTALDERLKNLAVWTGGQYYLADSGSKLSDILYLISEDLKTAAAVNASMNLDYTNLTYTYRGEANSTDGNDAFDYIPDETTYTSTNINSWTFRSTRLFEDSINLVPSVPILYDNICNVTSHICFNPNVIQNLKYPYFVNQTSQWNNNRMDFQIGNITIGQIWQANFTLRSKIPGVITLFGSPSKITYESDGSSNVPPIYIPPLNITSLEEFNASPTQPGVITLTCPELPSDQNASFIQANWNMSYTDQNGTRKSSGKVTQIIEYNYAKVENCLDSPPVVDDTAQWRQFAVIDTLNPSDNYWAILGTEIEGTDVGNWSYHIRVNAREILKNGIPGADASKICYITCISRSPAIRIR